MKKFACYQSDALLKIFMNIIHCIICPFILLVDFSCSFSELLIIVRTTWEGGCTRCVLYYYWFVLAGADILPIVSWLKLNHYNFGSVYLQPSNEKNQIFIFLVETYIWAGKITIKFQSSSSKILKFMSSDFLWKNIIFNYCFDLFWEVNKRLSAQIWIVLAVSYVSCQHKGHLSNRQHKCVSYLVNDYWFTREKISKLLIISYINNDKENWIGT
jgi:hypothetical protein